MKTKKTAAVLSLSALTAGIAHGAITYTDVDPDTTLTVGLTTAIDLNADGDYDFKVLFDGDVAKPYINNSYNSSAAYVLAHANSGAPATPFGSLIDGANLVATNNAYLYRNGADVVGDWPNAADTDAYVGVEVLDSSSNIHFGWVHLAYNAADSTATSLTLKGYAYEDVAGVGIIAGATNELGAPDIYTSPQSATIAGGANVQMSVTALGAPAPAYQWMARPAGSGTFTNLIDAGNVSGSTTAVLSLSGVGMENALEYQVVVSNTLGSKTSDSATLSVIPAVLTGPTPATEKIFTGQTAQFSIGASSSATPAFQWRKGGVNLSEGGNVSGSTTDNLLISNLSASDAASYDVVVTTLYGSVTSSVAPLSVVATNGGSYEQSVIAEGPVAYYRLNETDPANNGGVVAYDFIRGYNGTYKTSVNNGVAGPLPSDGLPGFNADNTGAQFYQNNSSSRIALAPLNLNTNTVTFLAWINPSSVGQHGGSGIIYTRSTNNMVCGLTVGSSDISGNVPLSYNWNDQMGAWNWTSGLSVPPNAWSLVALVITPTNATIYAVGDNGISSAVNTMTHAVQSFNDVEYIGTDPASGSITREFDGVIDEVAVFNKSLTFSQVTTLYARAKGLNGLAPKVTTQPMSLVLYTNQTAHFTVAASGSQPLSYQWQFSSGGAYANLADTANVSGSSTSELIIKNVTAANIGSYVAVITNAGGTVTSSAGSLSLIPASGKAAQSAILALGPVAYYELNELSDPASGSAVAFDHVGGFNGLYGTAVTNGSSNIAGPTANDGFSGFASANTAALLTPALNYQSQITTAPLNLVTDSMTFTAWINPSGPQQPYAGLIFSRPATPDRSGFNYSAQTNAAGLTCLGYHWNDDYGTYMWNSGLVPPSNQWSFVSLVITPTNATIWVMNTNGVTSATHDATHALSSFVTSMTIGKDPMDASTNYSFSGVIDEVGIFATALTSNQLTALYSAAGNVIVPQPVAISIQSVPTGLQLTWPQGTLLESTNVMGPWTTNSSAASGYIVNPDAGQKFYRILVQ